MTGRISSLASQFNIPPLSGLAISSGLSSAVHTVATGVESARTQIDATINNASLALGNAARRFATPAMLSLVAAVGLGITALVLSRRSPSVLMNGILAAVRSRPALLALPVLLALGCSELNEHDSTPSTSTPTPPTPTHPGIACTPVSTDVFMNGEASRAQDGIRLTFGSENPDIDGIVLHRFDMSCEQLYLSTRGRTGNQCYSNVRSSLYYFNGSELAGLRNGQIEITDRTPMSTAVRSACYVFIPFTGDCSQSSSSMRMSSDEGAACYRIPDRSTISRSVNIR